MSDLLQEHLAGGITTLCRLWRLERRDGVVLGFTDHDCDLSLDGVVYRAGTGLTARAFEQVTGLAVDNSEVTGALRDGGIEEADLRAGRYDAAELRIWLVNWADLAQRREIFRGSLGEVTLKGLAFRAELRGLAEPLNQTQGRIYTRDCAALLGDGACGFYLGQAGYQVMAQLLEVDAEGRLFTLEGLESYAPKWFEHGKLEMRSGAGLGLSAMVRADRIEGSLRRIELWQGIRAALEGGDQLRLTAGCDRLAETCRAKFANFSNFRGFPHLPGDDWLTALPRQTVRVTGG